VAARGHAETQPNGDRFLVLLDGRRYEGNPGSAEYKITEFERYSIRIEAEEAAKYFPSNSSAPTRELLDDLTPNNQGELIWRFGIPVSALVLSLLAVPLSFVNPRAGRSLNLILSVLLYMIYSNLLSISQSWVGQGRVPPVVGWVAVHVAMVSLLVFLLWRRISVTPLLPLKRV